MTYLFRRFSTDFRTTGKVTARLLRDEQKARTVFNACEVLEFIYVDATRSTLIYLEHLLSASKKSRQFHVSYRNSCLVQL